MSEDGREWRLLVMRPGRLLLWLNAVAAIGCFGLVLYWLLAGFLLSQWTVLSWSVYLLALGGFLSVVYFLGSWLERR